MAELIILDVGHGNCAIVRGDTNVSVIDCAYGATLIDTLDLLGISEVSHLLISHADEDHIAGGSNLLLEKHVHDVYVNPDIRKTDAWHDFRSALEHARIHKGTRVHPALTTDNNGNFDYDKLRLEIIAPCPEDALGGAEGVDIENRKQSANTMSVVVRVIHDSFPVALLAGDLDRRGFEHIKREGLDMRADILVFPHHGGTPRHGDPEEFARELCEVVNPTLIAFSMSRSRQGFPRSEILRGAKTTAPTAHIICTQLSQNCSSNIPLSDFKHLSSLPSRGKNEKSCCGGTILVELNGSSSRYESFIDSHSEFVNLEVPTPMCTSF